MKLKRTSRSNRKVKWRFYWKNLTKAKCLPGLKYNKCTGIYGRKKSSLITEYKWTHLISIATSFAVTIGHLWSLKLKLQNTLYSGENFKYKSLSSQTRMMPWNSVTCSVAKLWLNQCMLRMNPYTPLEVQKLHTNIYPTKENLHKLHSFSRDPTGTDVFMYPARLGQNTQKSVPSVSDLTKIKKRSRST